IHPFALRKVFLVIVALLCFSALCLADPVLMVHRFTGSPGHLPAVSTAPATLQQEPLGPQRPSDTGSGFSPFGSIDFPGNQTELRFTEAGKVGLPPALPSSVFAKPM